MRPRFVTIGHHFGVYPGIDLNRICRLADDLEDKAIIEQVLREDRPAGNAPT
jgi:hypothetical protein